MPGQMRGGSHCLPCPLLSNCKVTRLQLLTFPEMAEIGYLLLKSSADKQQKGLPAKCDLSHRTRTVAGNDALPLWVTRLSALSRCETLALIPTCCIVGTRWGRLLRRRNRKHFGGGTTRNRLRKHPPSCSACRPGNWGIAVCTEFRVLHEEIICCSGIVGSLLGIIEFSDVLDVVARVSATETPLSNVENIPCDKIVRRTSCPYLLPYGIALIAIPIFKESEEGVRWSGSCHNLLVREVVWRMPHGISLVPTSPVESSLPVGPSAACLDICLEGRGLWLAGLRVYSLQCVGQEVSIGYRPRASRWLLPRQVVTQFLTGSKQSPAVSIACSSSSSPSSTWWKQKASLVAHFTTAAGLPGRTSRISNELASSLCHVIRVPSRKSSIDPCFPQR